MIITISHPASSARRYPNSRYRTAAESAPKAATTRDKDFIEHIYTASAQLCLLSPTADGAHWLTSHIYPEEPKTIKGRATKTFYRTRRPVKAFIRVKGLTTKDFVMIAQSCVPLPKRGIIKKTSLEAYFASAEPTASRLSSSAKATNSSLSSSPDGNPRSSSWPTVTDQPYASTKAKSAKWDASAPECAE